jgi:transcriptional regulator with XRE-family HTH domain
MHGSAEQLRRQATDQHWGRRLREMRLECGLTLAELARSAGLQPGQVFEHECGLCRMKPTQIVRYAQVLGVRLSDFVRPTSYSMRAAGAPVSGVPTSLRH